MDDNTPTRRSLDQLGHLGTVEELTKRLGDNSSTTAPASAGATTPTPAS
jgi:hypothetical protein